MSTSSSYKVREEYKDFKNFLYIVWKYLNLPDPTPIQYDLADYLQHGPKRCQIQAFRGVGKSYITAAFVVWTLYLDPQKKIEVVSASKTLADNFSTFCFQIINNIPELAVLRPRDDQRNSKIQFDVGPTLSSKDPSVKSVGVTGQISGSRADLLIADDIEVPSNSMTQTQREKLSELVKEFDAVMKPDGRIIYLGTPQTEMSLYNTLQERGYECRIWPARFPDKVRVERYGDRLAPKILSKLESTQYSVVGKPTEPLRFNEEDLLEREASYGKSGFALQFMLDTQLSDLERYPLKINDLIVMDLDSEKAPNKVIYAGSTDYVLENLPTLAMNGDKFHKPMQISDEFSPYTGSVMFIDPAGRGKDETAYAIVNILNSQLFVMEVKGLQGGYEEQVLTQLAQAAKQYQVKKIMIESNFGDGMFTRLLQPVLGQIYPCSTEEIRHSTQKEARIIDTLEPVMNRHRLIINTRIIHQDFNSIQKYSDIKKQQYSLFYQMTRITRDKGSLAHDDRLEALAGAVNYWTQQMAQDVDEAAEIRKQEALEQMLKKYHDNLGIFSQQSNNQWQTSSYRL